MPALPADHKQLNWTCQSFHLAFLYALQWLGEQMRQSSAQDLDQHALTDGFGFDRFVRATVLVTAILFRDDRQFVVCDLLLRQHDPLPRQRAHFAFKSAPGVILDLTAGQAVVAQVEHACAPPQLRGDIGPLELRSSVAEFVLEVDPDDFIE